LEDGVANQVLEAVEKLETLDNINGVMEILRCDGGVQ